jgi:hypothetical protein
MGPIAMTALAGYPALTYVAQDLPTLSLLVDGTPLLGGTPHSTLPLHADHPFFRERRTRFYVDPWPWIEDLREFDYSFGTRIHGAIAALLAGTPATVLAHDSRTLELARYFAIPHRLLREVPGDVDPADLYAEADFTGLHAGHGERFAAFVHFLGRSGLDHVFAHAGAAAAFDRRVAETRFPGAVGPVPEAVGGRGLQSVARRLRARARRLATSPGGGRRRPHQAVSQTARHRRGRA